MPDSVAGTEADQARPETARKRGSARALAIGVLVVVAAAGAMAIGTRDAPDDGAADDQAAAFSLPSIRNDGETVSLDLRDGRPAVVNFFALSLIHI